MLQIVQIIQKIHSPVMLHWIESGIEGFESVHAFVSSIVSPYREK